MHNTKKMTAAEEIYYIKVRWNDTWEELAFKFGTTIDEIQEIYAKEAEKQRQAIKKTMESDINCLGIDPRIRNLLKRHRINTIRQLIVFEKESDIYFEKAGLVTVWEILDAANRARKELNQ